MISLLGHLKAIKVQASFNNQADRIMISPFSQETYMYLSSRDILNLTCLSRQFSETFMKYNSRLFIRIFNLRNRDLQSKLKEVSHKSEIQEIILKKHEVRDQIRQTMSADASDDKVKNIIEKHVVIPHRQHMSNNVDIAQSSG